MHPKDEDNYEPYDMEETGSDNSEYEPPKANTESSMEESAESDSDYDDNEGGFKRLNNSSKDKQLVIKDGKIIKPDKLKGKDKGIAIFIYAEAVYYLYLFFLTFVKQYCYLVPEQYLSFSKSTPIAKLQNKLNAKKPSPPNKSTPTNISAFQLGTTNYASLDISPPSPRSKEGFKVNGIKPIDVAAHLKLLGESLTIIGERLKEHEVIYKVLFLEIR